MTYRKYDANAFVDFIILGWKTHTEQILPRDFRETKKVRLAHDIVWL